MIARKTQVQAREKSVATREQELQDKGMQLANWEGGLQQQAAALSHAEALLLCPYLTISV